MREKATRDGETIEARRARLGSDKGGERRRRTTRDGGLELTCSPD